MVTISQKGDFKKLNKFFKKSIKITKTENIELFAQKCIEKLKEVTPVNSGLTRDSWSYTVRKEKGLKTLCINNTNIQNGVNVALLLEFGHASRDGSWVEGHTFIEPAVIKAYLDIMDSVWKEMKNL